MTPLQRALAQADASIAAHAALETLTRTGRLQPPLARLSWITDEPQTWHDPVRGADRVCRFTGHCIGCGERTYGFDDGENDPRGVLGLRAASPVAPQDHGYPADLPTLPACYSCMDTHGAYLHVVDVAERQWRSK